MLPYTYSLAAQVVVNAYTMMRSLMFDFANDKNVKDIADEYMFGPAFLVAPVVEPYEFGPDSTPLGKETVRDVYLPEGTDWYDYETRKVYEGGQTIKADAPVSKLPLYVRAGAIIPKAADTDGTPAKIEIYSGADGMFALYLDNGKDYAYEKGENVSIPLMWSEEKQTLLIGKAVGNYPVPEKFHVELILKDGTTLTQDVPYTGEDILVQV